MVSESTFDVEHGDPWVCEVLREGWTEKNMGTVEGRGRNGGTEVVRKTVN